jgi:hypothetical protein
MVALALLSSPVAAQERAAVDDLGDRLRVSVASDPIPNDTRETLGAVTPSRRLESGQPPTVTSARQPLGVRAFGIADINALTAQNSFNAVLGSSRLTAFGGGVDVLNVWNGAFLRFAVSTSNKTGSRAFVANGQAATLNIPLTVSMTPVEVGGGWRFLTRTRAVPYVGGGFLAQLYSEKSTFAGPGEDVSQTNFGYMALGGIEVETIRWLFVGVEAQFRGVPNAIGQSGVSQGFGETNLGGFTARVLIGVKH